MLTYNLNSEMTQPGTSPADSSCFPCFRRRGRTDVCKSVKEEEKAGLVGEAKSL